MAADGVNVWLNTESPDRLLKLETVGDGPDETIQIALEIALPGPANDLVFDGSHFWLSVPAVGGLLRVSPDGTVETISAGASNPDQLVFDGCNIFAPDSDGFLYKHDPADGTVVGSYRMRTQPIDLFFDGVYIWSSNEGGIFSRH